MAGGSSSRPDTLMQTGSAANLDKPLADGAGHTFLTMAAPVIPSEVAEAYRVDRLHIGASNPVGLPHLAVLLAAVAGRVKPRRPVCIVVPSIEGLAELTGVLVAINSLGSDAADLTKQAASLIFVPGTRVRALVNRDVFEVVSRASISGLDGFWLQPADKNSQDTNARFLSKAATRFFSRERPLGRATSISNQSLLQWT
jgi:hypothetical protein